MTATVFLVGRWPSGIVSEIEEVLGPDARVNEAGIDEGRGAMPWADIGSLVSAAAAVITVGMMLWDRRKSVSQPTGDLVEENRAVRSQGVFDAKITKIVTDGAEQYTVRVRSETSAVSTEFAIEMKPEGVSVSLKDAAHKDGGDDENPPS